VTDVRRVLRHLLEMGETELVFDAPAASAGAVAPAAPPPAAEADAAPSPPADSSGEAPLPAKKTSDIGGPPMYGPGLVIDPPSGGSDLFAADPIAAQDTLAGVARLIAECQKCGLHASRTNTVPGEGNPDAGLVCVGEAPGQTEDETGRPFVGRAGKLLTDILGAIGLAREEVFICNVLKCRPPGNRNPEPLEATACSPYLHRQLELIRPKVILALGKPAATTLLQSNASLGDLRGQVHRYRGIPLVVTYHPAALLRNPNWKPATWDDVRIARRILDGEAC